MIGHMKKLLFLAITTAILGEAQAQSYVMAGGLRMGTDWGLTYQQRVLETVTIEAILQSSFQREEVMVTALFEKHYPVAVKGLNLYLGAGPHKGWNSQPRNENNEEIKDPLGLSLVGGAELTLGRIAVSYDIKPAINVRGGDRAVYMQSGLSARYVFLSNRDVRKMKRKKERERRRKEGFDWKEDWKFWKKAD